MQGARTALDGVRKRELTLAIGFGADAAGAGATAGASLARGFRPAAARFVAGWRDYLELARRAAGARRRRCASSTSSR